MVIERYMDIVSGKSRGLAAPLVRGMLWMLSWPYWLVAATRNAMFDGGLKTIHEVAVPVIAVGNLTTGGTGKTPIVATVVQLLQDIGLTPGIVSRGYHSDESGTNDEKRVLAQLCPAVPHQQNPDRVAAANALIESEGVTVIVLDDAFQHRRIHRQLNIVLIDATNPFGFDHLLPRGLLRESLSGLCRANLVLITRADAVCATALQKIRDTIATHNSSLAERTFPVSFQPTGLLSGWGEQRPLASIANQRVVVATAIGNPAAFVATCETMKADVVATMFFPDHHHYSTADIDRIQQSARTANADTILTTLKDLVKIPQDQSNFQAVQIDTVFESEAHKQQIRHALQTAVQPSDV